MSEQDERWKSLMNIWLEGALHASTFILGTQVKLFTRAMSNVATDLLMQAAQQQYGLQLPKTDSMVKALESLMAVEIKAGLAEEGELSATAKDEYTAEVTVAGCPYGQACGRFLAALQETGEFNKDEMPCLRANCYGVAVARLMGHECAYRLVQFAPGVRCRARLEAV